ncbi:GDP-6-deoxy-D-mannose reductase [compost metagenome]
MGQTLNVCSGQAHSLRDIIAMCQALTGHELRVQVNPAFVRANEVKTLCGDASRLRTLLGGWETVPLEDTLRWMLVAE